MALISGRPPEDDKLEEQVLKHVRQAQPGLSVPGRTRATPLPVASPRGSLVMPDGTTRGQEPSAQAMRAAEYVLQEVTPPEGPDPIDAAIAEAVASGSAAPWRIREARQAEQRRAEAARQANAEAIADAVVKAQQKAARAEAEAAGDLYASGDTYAEEDESTWEQEDDDEQRMNEVLGDPEISDATKAVWLDKELEDDNPEFLEGAYGPYANPDYDPWA